MSVTETVKAEKDINGIIHSIQQDIAQAYSAKLDMECKMKLECKKGDAVKSALLKLEKSSKKSQKRIDQSTCCLVSLEKDLSQLKILLDPNDTNELEAWEEKWKYINEAVSVLTLHGVDINEKMKERHDLQNSIEEMESANGELRNEFEEISNRKFGLQHSIQAATEEIEELLIMVESNKKDKMDMPTHIDPRLNIVSHFISTGVCIGWLYDTAHINNEDMTKAINVCLESILRNTVVVKTRMDAVTVIDELRNRRAGRIRCEVISDHRPQHRSMKVSGHVPLRTFVDVTDDSCVDIWDNICAKWAIMVDEKNTWQIKNLGINIVSMRGDIYAADGEIRVASASSRLEHWMLRSEKENVPKKRSTCKGTCASITRRPEDIQRTCTDLKKKRSKEQKELADTSKRILSIQSTIRNNESLKQKFETSISTIDKKLENLNNLIQTQEKNLEELKKHADGGCDGELQTTYEKYNELKIEIIKTQRMIEHDRKDILKFKSQYEHHESQMLGLKAAIESYEKSINDQNINIIEMETRHEDTKVSADAIAASLCERKKEENEHRENLETQKKTLQGIRESIATLRKEQQGYIDAKSNALCEFKKIQSTLSGHRSEGTVEHSSDEGWWSPEADMILQELADIGWDAECHAYYSRFQNLKNMDVPKGEELVHDEIWDNHDRPPNDWESSRVNAAARFQGILNFEEIRGAIVCHRDRSRLEGELLVSRDEANDLEHLLSERVKERCHGLTQIVLEMNATASALFDDLTGHTGRLVMQHTHPDNYLSSSIGQITISVQPDEVSPWTSLHQLSAGQKAQIISCISLASILLGTGNVKLSPIIWMDELDSSMDARAVSKLQGILRSKFSKSNDISLIVVSHRPNMFTGASRIIGVYRSTLGASTVAYMDFENSGDGVNETVV
eukprot:GHVO01067436.1.p1 GENE.GHVO01067436.1~~GHVO01067436.1.p1  ORF type:complete len:1003 (+),score=202.09 GHVO01067436.1:285-3011(+)